MQDLTARHCQNLPASTPAMTAGQIAEMLATLSGWRHHDGAIRKNFEFTSFEKTISFANAVAWIAQREDHHPDMAISYSRCEVAYRTHSINGISSNDFICAAKIEALF